jgi:hypothetical protein
MRRIALPLILAALPLAAAPAFAGAAEQEAVRADCTANLNVPAGTCDCLAGKAANMTEGQQQLLAAMLTHDEPRATALRAQLPVQEQVQVATFHLHQVPACAAG